MLSCRSAPVSVRPSGVPFRSMTQCRFGPARPRLVWRACGRHRSETAGERPVSPVPFLPRWTPHPAKRGTSRARPPGRAVPTAPGATRPTLPPIPQAPPAGHARAAHLSRQHLPADARPQDEDDAGQGSAVVTPRSATPRLGRFTWQKRLDRRPEIIREKGLAHSPSTLEPRFC